jgi:hypothetical protein
MSKYIKQNGLTIVTNYLNQDKVLLKVNNNEKMVLTKEQANSLALVLIDCLKIVNEQM